MCLSSDALRAILPPRGKTPPFSYLPWWFLYAKGPLLNAKSTLVQLKVWVLKIKIKN